MKPTAGCVLLWPNELTVQTSILYSVCSWKKSRNTGLASFTLIGKTIVSSFKIWLVDLWSSFVLYVVNSKCSQLPLAGSEKDIQNECPRIGVTGSQSRLEVEGELKTFGHAKMTFFLGEEFGVFILVIPLICSNNSTCNGSRNVVEPNHIKKSVSMEKCLSFTLHTSMMYKGEPKWINNECDKFWPYVKLNGAMISVTGSWTLMSRSVIISFYSLEESDYKEFW